MHESGRRHTRGGEYPVEDRFHWFPAFAGPTMSSAIGLVLKFLKSLLTIQPVSKEEP